MRQKASMRRQARPFQRPWRSLVRELAEGIKDEALRARFLAGPQIYQVLQHAHGGHPLI
jgi:hypothetical protein